MSALEQLKDMVRFISDEAASPQDQSHHAMAFVQRHGHALVELIEAARLATFHLRRGDHVGDSGHVCTSSIIESLDAALRKLTEDKPT